MTEVIAACGFETGAPGVGEHSFTRSLIDELRYWSGDYTLSVANLHNKVLSRIKYWKPRFGSTGEHERRKTPIYVVLANEKRKRSIELIPLQPRETPPQELAADSVPVPSPQSSNSSGPQTSVDGNVSDSSQSSLEQLWPDSDFRSPKVLISLALEEDQWLHTNDWVKWMQSVPALTKYARVDGIYKTGSTLMLLSIPVAIWDLLPKDPAISFIGFVESANMLGGSPRLSTFSNKSQVQDPEQWPTVSQQMPKSVANNSNKSRTPSYNMATILEKTDEEIGNDDKTFVQPKPGKRGESADAKTALHKPPTYLEAILSGTRATPPPLRPLPGPPDAAPPSYFPAEMNTTFDRLIDYETVFVIDQTTEKLWSETLYLLKTLVDKLIETGPAVRYRIEYMDLKKQIREVSIENLLRTNITKCSDHMYQYLCSRLDDFTLTQLSLSNTERQKPTGLNLIVISGGISARLSAGLKELLVETASGLNLLRVPKDKVFIQFVHVDNNPPAPGFLEVISDRISTEFERKVRSLVP